MKRIIRERRLTAEEAAKYREIREQVDRELPELIARHHQRIAALERIDVLKQLKAAREQSGMSLAEISECTGVDRATLLNLESDQRTTPRVETVLRHADAIGMSFSLDRKWNWR